MTVHPGIQECPYDVWKKKRRTNANKPHTHTHTQILKIIEVSPKYLRSKKPSIPAERSVGSIKYSSASLSK